MTHRLDLYLVETLQKPRSWVQNYIKNGGVKVNGLFSKPAYIVRDSDVLTFEESLPQMPKTEPRNSDKNELSQLDFLYEDNAIIVINKPAGWVVHPGEGNPTNTLVDILKEYTAHLSSYGPGERAGIVHRLDKFTEGLMVIAKTNEAHEMLAAQFKNSDIKKKYYAMVKGNVLKEEMVIERGIARHPHQRVKFTSLPLTSDSPMRYAKTKINILKRYQTKTLLDVTPYTGRTHQIRVHLAHIEHPIIGDPLYSKTRGEGQLLQAYFLSFVHPETRQRMSFQLPLSERLIT